MKKINLLVDIPNIRNTIRPDSVEPKQQRRKRIGSKTPLVALLVFALAGALWLNLSGNRDKGPLRGVTDKAAVNKTPVAVEKKRVEIKVEPKQKPAENVKAEPKLAPIVSRPVARDAVAVRADKPAKVEWILRFGLCMYKKSCERIVKKLKKTGVYARVAKTTANIKAYRVVMGPWGMESLAGDAGLKLKKSGVVSAAFSAEDKYYLATNASAKKKPALELLKKVNSLGYRAKLTLKKEPFEVYKVYGKAYGDEANARKKMQRLRSGSIECVLEKRSVQ